MWNRKFWAAAGERAVKTLAQSSVAAIIAAGTGLVDTDWLGVVSVAGMAAIISLLTSVGTDAATGDGPGFAESIEK